MLKNYLIIILRNLRKQKVFAVVNIFGLAIGLAASFVLLLFVQQQFSFDKGFVDSDRIYRVATDFFEMGGFAKSQEQLLDYLPGTTPAYEVGTRFDRGFRPVDVKIGDMMFEERQYFEVDSSYFQLFSYDFLEGNPAGVMAAPDEAILTSHAAKKYFGNTPALGQTLLVGKEEKAYRVTGVVNPPAFETHLSPNLWISRQPDTTLATSWTNVKYYNYIKLKPGTRKEDLEAGLETLLRRQVFPEGSYGGSFEEWRETNFAPRFWVQPLTDIHLQSDFKFEISAGGNLTLVYVLGAIGLFILLIASINYINLTTAASSSRIKEIGIKQSLGVERQALIFQFLLESVMFCLFAMLLAIGFSELLLRAYLGITGTVLVTSIFESGAHLTALFGFSVLVGLLAGLYPAIYLSGFRPLHLLKGASASRENQRVRRGLVVFQFSIAITLLIGSIIVQQQLSYLISTDKGFDHEGVLVVDNLRVLGQSQTESFRNELLQIPQVETAAFSRRVPTGSSISVYVYSTPELPDGLTLQTFRGDEHYLPALGMRLLAGRNFSGDLASDSSALILNESAVKALGLGDDPVGKKINDGEYVVGVVSDFNYQSLHERIEPAVIRYSATGSYLVVRARGNDFSGLLAAINATWQEFSPEEPMEYAFLDDNFAGLVANEEILSQTIALFTLMAILIACLGLFGLTTFSVRQRTKEIGIRKVVGASTLNLVTMLSKDFLKLVLWAFMIGAPLSFLTVNRWLETFAYHIEPGVIVFAFAGIVSVIVAFLTLSFQTLRAARANPVEALRYE